MHIYILYIQIYYIYVYKYIIHVYIYILYIHILCHLHNKIQCYVYRCCITVWTCTEYSTGGGKRIGSLRQEATLEATLEAIRT